MHYVLFTTIIYTAITSLFSFILRRICINNFICKPCCRAVLKEYIISMECVGIAMNKPSLLYIPNGLLYLFSICFILGVWRDYSWDTEDGNVTKTLENYLRRRCSATMSVLLLFAQVSGAYVATAYVRTFWLLKLHQIYTQMYREECKTCLQVGVAAGFFIEGGLTFFSRGTALLLKTFFSCNAIFTNILGIFISYNAMEYTGCFLNPVLASILTMGCKGTPILDHVLVYWVGPLLGTYLVVLIFESTLPRRRSRTNASTPCCGSPLFCTCSSSRIPNRR